MNSYEPGENEIGSGLFLGDKGELDIDTRRALVQLLSGPVLDGKRHTKLWPVLLINEEIIRTRLADLFLELVIDRDMQVAFTRQADTGELEVPHLLRKMRLTFIDSVLLLFLRQQFTQAENHNERAIVTKDDIEEHLSIYERTGNTDKAGFEKKILSSMKKFTERSILQKIGNDRFEISPTLKLLFSADVIIELTKRYKQIAEEGMPVSETEGDSEDE